MRGDPLVTKSEEFPGRRLLVVLALTIVSFTLSTAVTDRTGNSIQTEASAITRNAMPSIEHLATLRSELLHAQLIAGDLTSDRAGRVVAPVQLDQVRLTLERELKNYQALPRFQGEVALSERLAAELEEVTTALGDLEMAPSPEQAVDINLRAVHPAVDRASNLTQALIDFNAQAVDDEARQIEATRKRMDRMSIGLDAFCAAFCCLAGLLAWRTVKLYIAALGAERQLLEARATELEAFSGRVAHDILNPLAAVSLALGLVERAGPVPRVLDRAKASLGRAVSLVDGLLSFARSGAQPEPGATCEVGVVLLDALAGLRGAARESGIALEVEDVAEGAVACHPGVLASLLGNLVSNAIKYMGPSAQRRVVVRSFVRGTQFHFEVADTGVGIPLEQQARIFEPYVRANQGDQPGIGLGLATVKKLCTAHGGAVGLRSEPGRGSTFWFELPALWETGPVPAAGIPLAH